MGYFFEKPGLTMVEMCNLWREKYDTLSYEESKAFCTFIEPIAPHQISFDIQAAIKFFNTIQVQMLPNNRMGNTVENFRVLEIGGWKGELADYMLAKFGYKIDYWHNFDICEGARDKVKCVNDKYKITIPDDYVWNIDFEDKYNLLICSHCLEHMKKDNIVQLFKNIKTEYVYIEVPLPETCISNDWIYNDGTHVLEIGWKELIEIIENSGFGFLSINNVLTPFHERRNMIATKEGPRMIFNKMYCLGNKNKLKKVINGN